MELQSIAIGFDPRESAVYHVLQESILKYSSQPVAFIPLHAQSLHMDGQRDGTNAFIYSRFLVPYLMGYRGWALYMDSDMMVRDDPVKLWRLRDESKAVMCVQHAYQTTVTKKFIGTPMESPNTDYPRKNWSSLVLWNCGHPSNRILTKEFVSESSGRILHRFSWLSDDEIGSLPRQWNHLVGEYPYDPGAMNTHFTLGAPGFWYYRGCDYSDEWREHLKQVNHMHGESDV